MGGKKRENFESESWEFKEVAELVFTSARIHHGKVASLVNFFQLIVSGGLFVFNYFVKLI